MMSLSERSVPKEVRILIVDNSSTDETNLFFNQNDFGSIDLTYERISPNGLSQARNYGFKLVKTPYLVYFDDDSILENNCLKKLVDFLKTESPSAFSGAVNGVLPFNMERCLDLQTIGHDEHSNSKLPGNFMGLHREVLERIGGFNEQFGKNKSHVGYGEDTLLEAALVAHGYKCSYVPKASLYHLSLSFSKKEWKKVSEQHAFYRLKCKNEMGGNNFYSVKQILRSLYALAGIIITTVWQRRIDCQHKFMVLSEVASIKGYVKFMLS